MWSLRVWNTSFQALLAFDFSVGLPTNDLTFVSHTSFSILSEFLMFVCIVLCFTLFYACDYFACMCVCAQCIFLVLCGGQKRVTNPLEVELERFVSYYVINRNWTRVLQKINQCSNCESSLQTLSNIFCSFLIFYQQYIMVDFFSGSV